MLRETEKNTFRPTPLLEVDRMYLRVIAIILFLCSTVFSQEDSTVTSSENSAQSSTPPLLVESKKDYELAIGGWPIDFFFRITSMENISFMADNLSRGNLLILTPKILLAATNKKLTHTLSATGFTLLKESIPVFGESPIETFLIK